MRALIDYVTYAIDIIALLMLCNVQFERRVRPVVYWSSILVSAIICWNLFIQVGIPTTNLLLKLPINIAWLLSVIALHKGPWLQRIFVAIIYHIIMLGLDAFFYGVATFVSKTTMLEIFNNAPLSAFLAALDHIFKFAVFFLIAKLLKSRKEQTRISIWEWFPILLISAFTIMQLYIAHYALLDSPTASPFLPLQASMLLLMNISLLLLFDKLATRGKIQQENNALQEQMKNERLRLQSATESYEAQRTLTHDFDNRLLAIQQLLQYGKQNEALSYVQEVRASVAQTDVAVSTNNPLADAVLNQKYRRALELGVEMQFLLSDLSTFPLTGDELVTVLSNLLDNALEACQKIRTEGSIHGTLSIRVKLLMEDALATISVKNTSAPVTVDADGEVETTKKAKNLHGFGLKTCQKILKRSGFDFVVHYQNGWFQFTAMKAL